MQKKYLQRAMDNIIRNCDVLPNFPLSTRETKPDYLWKTGIYKLPRGLLNNLRLRIILN